MLLNVILHLTGARTTGLRAGAVSILLWFLYCVCSHSRAYDGLWIYCCRRGEETTTNGDLIDGTTAEGVTIDTSEETSDRIR